MKASVRIFTSSGGITGGASIVLAALLWSSLPCTFEPSNTIHRIEFPISFTMQISSSSSKLSNGLQAQDPWSWICRTTDIFSNHQLSATQLSPTSKLSAVVWTPKSMQRAEINLATSWRCCEMTKFRACIVTLMESKTCDNVAMIIHYTRTQRRL